MIAIFVIVEFISLDGVVLIDREVLAISPKPQSKVAILPLRPTRNLACTLRVQVGLDVACSIGFVVSIFCYLNRLM